MEILKKIGLTEHEIKVYNHLLNNGKSIASRIAKEIGLNRSLTYTLLEGLIQKGIVNYCSINKIKYFKPSDPNSLIDFLSQKQDLIEQQKNEVMKLIPGMTIKFTEKETQPEFEIYEGVEGFKSVLEDIVRKLKKGDFYYVIGYQGKFKGLAGHWFNHWNNRRAKKGITRRIIINEKALGAVKELPRTEARWLGKEHDIPLTTIIYADRVAIRLYVKEKPYVILIKSRDAYASFKKYFELIWESAKPIPL